MSTRFRRIASIVLTVVLDRRERLGRLRAGRGRPRERAQGGEHGQCHRDHGGPRRAARGARASRRLVPRQDGLGCGRLRQRPPGARVGRRRRPPPPPRSRPGRRRHHDRTPARGALEGRPSRDHPQGRGLRRRRRVPEARSVLHAAGIGGPGPGPVPRRREGALVLREHEGRGRLPVGAPPQAQEGHRYLPLLHRGRGPLLHGRAAAPGRPQPVLRPARGRKPQGVRAGNDDGHQHADGLGRHGRRP